MRIRRVFACPRSPRRMKWWRERMALTTCGTTVSSYPRMPGNSSSPRCILQIRFERISSLTVRLAIFASENELWRSTPKVRGNSCVALDKQTPLDGDCSRRTRIRPVSSITMTEVATQEDRTPTGGWSRLQEVTREVHRGFVAEWTVTIVLLLFATTALVQAFVIPSASMENTLLIGDHVLVDKLVFSPPGSIS